MIVAGHQPQYLPYLGIFNKIAKADAFVFADNLQFNKKSWQNRTLIRDASGNALMLTIPVKTSGKFYQDIKDVELDNTFWIKKHLKTISRNYQKTSGFEEVFPIVEECYGQGSKFLIDITIPLMIAFIKLLEIKIPISIGSEIGIEGHKTDLLVSICQKSGSDTYLSGEGAKAYFDQSVFDQNKLNHHFNLFSHPEYHQNKQPFLQGMAILDLFFNEGIEKSRDIFYANIDENSQDL